MALTTTSLGLQKPDGTEMVRDGDNVLTANAQKTDDLIVADRGRLTAIEAVNTNQDAALAALPNTYIPLSRGVLADGTDLNTLIGAQHVGDYSLFGGYTYPNAPAITGTATLEVRRGSGTSLSVVHRITYGTVLTWREAIDASSGTWPAWSQAQTTVQADATNAAQDGRLNAVESANAVQDSRLTVVESKNTAQDARLAIVESTNAVQDTSIANYTSRVSALETLGGLAPGSVTDATVTDLVTNPATTTAQAVRAGTVGLPADQMDSVAVLAARSKSAKLQLKKNGSTNEVEVSCLTPSGNHVTYQFYGSAAGDDYRVLANVWCGTSTAITAMSAKSLWSDLATTGTFAATLGAFVYTTDKTTPAQFTVPITVDVAGSSLRFNTYKDNRGGVWALTISGAELDNVVNVSTYSSAAGAYDSTGVTLMNNLRAGTYTVTGKFIGDDPANVPSGGAGTSRGWLANDADATSTSATLFSVYAPFRQVNKDILLKPASNMDIAMQVQPAGGSNLEWMPYHGIATMYQEDAPVYLDGDTVIDVAGMAIGAYRMVSSFELVQRVFGRNSASGSTNLVELATSHLIRSTGQVTVAGKWKALADIELGDNYHMMLPASMAIFDKVVTSIGNAYPTNPALIGTVTNLVAENDTAMSYMYLSSTNKSVAGAVRYTNPQETIRRGKASKNPDSTKAFIQHRDSSITKVYNRPYQPGTAIPAGTTQRFGGDYIYSQGLGIYDQFAL
jgi:hypothetical protein